MSTCSVSITAKGIGKIPTYHETDNRDMTKITIGGWTLELWQLYHDDDCIAFEEHVSWDNLEKLEAILVNMFHGKEFSVRSYCHDGYGTGYKSGIFNGKYKRWDEKMFDIVLGEYDKETGKWEYEDFEDDE